ncbi:response regulator [Magnetococcales bacterium HHB-1]
MSLLNFTAFKIPSLKACTTVLGAHEPILVFLSYLIAVLASLTALHVARRVLKENETFHRRKWIAVGGVVFGAGVWSTHFVAILAFKPPFPISFDLFYTVLSIVPAIIAGLITLKWMVKQHTALLRLWPGAVIIGLGIVAMHYLGMAALEIPAICYYDPLLFILSIVIAIGLSFLALRIRFFILPLQDKKYGRIQRLLVSALVMGFAIISMHYTGMAAAVFVPSSQSPVQQMMLNTNLLSGLIVIVMVTVSSLTLIASLQGKRESTTSFFGHLVSIGLLFLVTVGMLTWSALGEIEEQTRKELHSKLITVRKATHQALHLWIHSRFHDVMHWVERDGVVEAVENLLKEPPDRQSLIKSPHLKKLRQLVSPMLDGHRDLGFFVISKTGINMGSMRDNNLAETNLLFGPGEPLEAVLQGQQKLILPRPSDVPLPDLVGKMQQKEPTMFVATPIYHHQTKAIIGAFTIRLNPSLEFTRISQLARLGETGDSYILNHQGRFLTEPRFRDSIIKVGLLDRGERSVLNLWSRDPGGDLTRGYIPSTAPTLWPLTRSAQALIKKRAGINLDGYRDYRGSSVVGTWVWDSTYQFGLVFEIDRLEAYRSFYNSRRVIFTILALVAILFIASLIWIAYTQYQLTYSHHILSQAMQERAQAESKAMAWRNRYEVATMATGHILYDWDILNNTVTYGGALEKILGWSIQELKGSIESWHELIHPDDRELFFEKTTQFTDAKSNNEPLVFRMRCIWGNYITVEDYGDFYRNNQGEVIRMIGFVKDVTDRRLAEEKLRSSEERFRAITGAAGDAIISVNHRSEIIYLNPGACFMFGYRDESQLKGQSITMLMPERFHHAHLSAIRLFIGDYRTSVTPQPLEAFGLKQNGQEFPIEISLSNWHEEGEVFFSAIIRDITVRKKIENALVASQRTLAEAQEIAKLGNWEWDILTEHITWSSEIYRIFSFNEKEVEPSYENFLKAVHPEDRKRVIQAIDASLNDAKKPYWVEHRILLPDQTERVVLEQGKVVFDHEGQAIRMVGTVQDITESKKQEKLLKEAKEAAEEATRAKSEFLANMSHEIRTPLNAVTGLGHLLAQTDLTAKQLDYVTKMNASAQALLGIINDILDFSKIEAGKLELEQEIFSLNDVLEQLATILTVRAEEKGLELLFNVCDQVPPRFLGDALRLGQILINLGNNAVKFTEKGEIVLSITVMEEDEQKITLMFQMSDTGVGMSDAQVERLFQPFQQADTSTTRRYGGTGLGLTICHQLVTMMGGKIWVKSQVNKGSLFFFTATFDRAPDAVAWCKIPESHLHGKRVLVVDDNHTAREILVNFFRNMGFRVADADSGAEALALLQQAIPDDPFAILCVDWKMPHMNGLEVVQQIKADNITPAPASCIMVSAHGREEMRERMGQGGIDYFLSKPVTPSQLLDAVSSSFGSDDTTPSVNQQKLTSPPPSHFEDTHILLVEDNQINQQVATEILERANIQVDLASHGEEAVDMVRKRGLALPYDMILMDIQMPVMDGYQAARTICIEFPTLTTPIVAMTANAMRQDIEACKAAGMVEHLAKPIDVQRLFRVLNRLLPEHHQTDQMVSSKIEPREEIKAQYPETLPGLNIKQGLERLLGNVSLYRQLLESMQNDYQDAVIRLSEWIDQGHLTEAIRFSHAIKGLAGNLGAEPLYQQAKTLEMHLKASQTEQYQESLADFANIMEMTRSSVAVWLDLTEEKKTASEELTEGHEKQELDLEKLKQLRLLLEDMDMNAGYLLEEQQAALSAAGFADEVERLTMLINGLDYEAAIEIIDGILDNA